MSRRRNRQPKVTGHSDMFVLKVQRPLGGTDTSKLMLYNRDRSVQWFEDCTSEAGKALLAALGEHPKAYFLAYLDRSIVRIESFHSLEEDW